MANRSGIVRTTRGKTLDMNRLSKDNPNSVAMTAGGISMNARGDILGRGGRVIKTREEVERAYNIANEKATKHVASRPVSIKKTNISPDNLPEETKLRIENEKKSAGKQEPKTFTLEEVSEVIEQSETRRKRKTTDE